MDFYSSQKTTSSLVFIKQKQDNQVLNQNKIKNAVYEVIFTEPVSNIHLQLNCDGKQTLTPATEAFLFPQWAGVSGLKGAVCSICSFRQNRFGEQAF